MTTAAATTTSTSRSDALDATRSPALAAAAGACGRTLTGSTVDRRLLGPLVVLWVRISRGRGSGSRVHHDPGDDRPRHDRDGRLFVLRKRVEGAEDSPPLDRAEPIGRLRQHDPVDLQSHREMVIYLDTGRGVRALVLHLDEVEEMSSHGDGVRSVQIREVEVGHAFRSSRVRGQSDATLLAGSGARSSQEGDDDGVAKHEPRRDQYEPSLGDGAKAEVSLRDVALVGTAGIAHRNHPLPGPNLARSGRPSAIDLRLCVP